MFYTWDFSYGSKLIIGYKNWLGNDFPVSGMNYKNYTSNPHTPHSIHDESDYDARNVTIEWNYYPFSQAHVYIFAEKHYHFDFVEH